MADEFIRMVHPETGGMTQATPEGFELAHKPNGWKLLTDQGALDDVSEDQLRQAAAEWGFDLQGVSGKDAIVALLREGQAAPATTAPPWAGTQSTGAGDVPQA